jgi:hypothetical protein
MKNINYLGFGIGIILVISLNACVKIGKDEFKIKVIDANTKESIRNYPIQLMEYKSAIFGGSYYKLEEKNTDENGYVIFIRENDKETDGYQIKIGDAANQVADTSLKYFGETLKITETGETTFELRPRGYLGIVIDSTIAKFPYIYNVEVSNAYTSKTLIKAELNKGFTFYVKANSTSEFKFRIQAPFYDTLITRSIYVRDYVLPSGGASIVTYIFSY